MFYRIAAFALVAFSIGAPVGAETGVRGHSERFDYSWSLAGFKGALVRLFVPGRGEGRLTTVIPAQDDSSGTLKTELLISSQDGKKDEFWLYGSEIDPIRKRTIRSWSSQRFRGKDREKAREAGDIEALDLASSIYYLRRERPDSPREELIWSSGRLNAVVIQPGERGSALWNGQETPTRSYSIEGVPRPGKPTWEGRLDLVVTDTEEAIPLEIVVMRKGLRVRLQLVEAASPSGEAVANTALGAGVD